MHERTHLLTKLLLIRTRSTRKALRAGALIIADELSIKVEHHFNTMDAVVIVLCGRLVPAR